MPLSPFYIARFYLKSLPRLLLPQKLSLSCPLHWESSFKISPKNRRAWNALFGKPRKKTPPFTVFWPVCVESFLNAITQLGIRYQNILHLGNEIRFFGNVNLKKLSGPLKVSIVYRNVLPYGPGKIVFWGETTVRSASGKKVMTLDDFILAKNISNEEWLKLKPKSLPAWLNKKTKPLKKKDISFQVSPTLGHDYGFVSGDLNPVHLSRKSARLFGYPEAFLPGLCTQNLMIKIFAGDFGEKLKRIRIRFLQPLFVGQEIEIRHDASAFEVRDEKGRLVAAGSRA